VAEAIGIDGTVDDMMRRGDAALYEAKRRGRNGYFCDGAGTPDGLPQSRLDVGIREAGIAQVDRCA